MLPSRLSDPLERVLDYAGDVSPTSRRTIMIALAVMLPVYAPSAYLLLTFMMMVWLPSHLVGMRAELSERQAAEQWAAQRYKTVEYRLRTALERVAVLEGELEEAQRHPSTKPEALDRLYRRVGLHGGCPDFLIIAARRAYRVALHPDQHLEHRKPEAEKRFVAAETTFEQIAQRRGL